MGLAIKHPQIWELEEIESPKDNVETIEKESVSGSITQTWTDQAIQCYLIQANCAQCPIPKANYSFTCQMHKVVPVLIESLGKPDAQRIDRVLPYLED